LSTDLSEVFIQRSIVCIFFLMSVISLFSIYFSNPGFVSDYFYSEELTPVDENTRRFAIYGKYDYRVNVDGANLSDAVRVVSI